jgi:hypothetical protein
MALSHYLVENEHSDEKFNDLLAYMTFWLTGLHKTKPRDARRWLYDLMQTTQQW